MPIKTVREIRDPKSDRKRFDQGQGSESISGHMPNPDSDDNALEAAQSAGLYLKSKSEKQQSVGIGREINNAQKEV